MAEQRAFLLSKATAPYCLFLDDDVLLESDLLERLNGAMLEQACGFVGSALHGLSFIDDIRPHQQHIEFWDGRVEPESVSPGSPAWARHHLHSAANLFHVQTKLGLRARARGSTGLHGLAVACCSIRTNCARPADSISGARSLAMKLWQDGSAA